MSLLEALQEANNAVDGIKGLSFINLEHEHSILVESFEYLDWPRNIVAPPSVRGTLKNNRSKEIIPISGFMVTRINQDTNDYRSVQIEPEFIAPMRNAARKFIISLANSDLTDPEVEDITFTIDSQYRWLANHLFGVVYSMRWPIRKGLCL